MDKALDILEACLKRVDEVDGENYDYILSYWLSKAIEELEDISSNRREWYQKGYNEAINGKTCEGCKYQKIDIDRCDFCKRCYSDQYEPKDNAWVHLLVLKNIQ